MSSSTLYHRANNFFYKALITSSALVVGGLLLFIVGFLAFEASPFFAKEKMGLIFNSTGWYPSEGQFNLWPMLVGSLAVSFLALTFSLPIAILSALYMNFYAPRLTKIVLHRLLEVLAGIPSVIFGLWGLVSFVPFVQNLNIPGASLITAALVLFLMITPTTTLFISGQFQHFPKDLMRTTLGLGISRQSILTKVVLPWSRPGIVASSVLGFGRAIGETVAVLMVSGNIVQLPNSLFVPIRTLTANIALEMGYAVDFHRAALFVSGFLLSLVITFLVLGVNSRSKAFG